VGTPPTLANAVRRAEAPRATPSVPMPPPSATSTIAALENLLRCGAWREGMRASALVASDAPDHLPPGAHRALHALTGVARPTARDVGNALKRVVDRRVHGIERTLTRRVDGHGFAVWQVVDDLGQARDNSVRPANADLVRNALTGLGYRRTEAEHAVSVLGAAVDTKPLAELVRDALGVLARGPVPGSRQKGR
jgi:hypothetical protein